MFVSSRRAVAHLVPKVSRPVRPISLAFITGGALAGLVLGGAIACSAGGSSSPSSTPGPDPTGGSGNGSGGTSSATAAEALPARVRRLTNAEYDASVRVLLGATFAPSVELGFPPDAKQGPANSPAGAAFTVNDAQRVDPVLVQKLDAAALQVVAEARSSGRLEALAPCADPNGAGAEACAKEFIQSFGAKAYRRPLLESEVAGLLSAYRIGASGYTHSDGIDVVTRILLQSPGFLYLTEIGAEGAGAAFTMTPSEIAMSLSYLLTAEPPDDELLSAAATGKLASAEGREAQARRLLTTPAGRARFVRVVREWLGIDDVARREKSQTVYPEFSGVSQAIEEESRAFIDEVLTHSSGSLTELLTADWTIADPKLAAIYGVPAAAEGQRLSLAGVARRGILNQAAFLSVFASNNGSHPVFRGVALMRRLACVEIPDPGALGIVVSFPAADATKTTRDRFSQHAMDANCANCHKTIDNFGFALEAFDGMGKQRSTENGLPVDTSVTLNVGSDLDGSYADALELMSALSKSEAVKACLARQIFRSTAARSDESVRPAEDAFVETWKTLPPEQQDRLADVLVAFVKSPLFVQRRMP
jgi:hypothetical protein